MLHFNNETAVVFHESTVLSASIAFANTTGLSIFVNVPTLFKVDDGHKRALTILTNIGCSLSLVAIFVTVSIYFVFG